MKPQFLIAGMIAIMFINIIGTLDAEDELKVSQIAPAFILKTLDGSEVVRSKNIFSEKKLTVLIFWDSYCPDCLKTLADCQKFYKNADKLSVGLCSINFDKEENLPKVRGFLKGEEITFPILSDPLSVTVRKYKAKAYDFSFFIIDKRRIIRHVCYDHPPNVGEVIKKEVEKLLKEMPALEPFASLEGKLREGLKVSEPAPNFILKTLDESKVVQSKKVFLQKELTVLIFWNSEASTKFTLDPDPERSEGEGEGFDGRRKECLDAIAEFQKFYNESEKLNVGVLSINFDEELTKTKNFVKEKKLTFPILSDIRAVAPKLYKVEDYCFSLFIVDKEGIIRYISYEFPPNIVEVLKTEIEKLRTKDEK